MMEETEILEENERGRFCDNRGRSPSKTRVVSLGSSGNRNQITLNGPSLKKACFSYDESLLIGSQDADYCHCPLFSEEVEVTILARIPITEWQKLRLLNKKYLSLSKDGGLFKIRRELGVEDLYVFVLATGDKTWSAFDKNFLARRRLPELPADPCFFCSDRETLCAGSHLLVSGMETMGPAIWRYELGANRWFSGPSMSIPRCLFASATNGERAFVAGGIGTGSYMRVLNSAEIYNSDSKVWSQLPNMNKKRKLCAGIFMDSRFYVLGGRDEHGEALTCGEVFYEDENRWIEIPDILKDSPVALSHSPPLAAVVNNQLYIIETSSNQLKVYLKEINCWKKLGPVPIITDSSGGWGVAFKALGDKLLVMGGVAQGYAGHGLAVYTCEPDLNAEDLNWRLFNGGQNLLSHFIQNCSVMAA